MDIFFPGRGETSEAAVMKYCVRCKVRTECGDYADEHGIEVGVWGGRRRTRTSEE